MSFVRAHTNALAIGVLFAVVLVLSAQLALRVIVAPHTYTSISDVPSADVAIVLGASVYQGKPSPILAARADAAIELYDAGKVHEILVSGDNGELNHDEVTPVRKYLLAAGIPAEHIFLDHAGFDTYSSMYRAKAVFDVRSATVVTQDFHMGRALFLARTLGIDASGYVAAGTGSPFDSLREIPASWKALLDLLVRREPKYLGKSVLLTGDGRKTWY